MQDGSEEEKCGEKGWRMDVYRWQEDNAGKLVREEGI